MREIEKRRLLSKMESFGLGSTDADIYLASLEIGPATIQELSKVTKLNRVTVHSAVERATRKGFFSESRKKNRRLIVPADPNVLRQIVERKERELQSMSDGIEQMIESLSGIQTTSRYFPTVRFYEGSEGFLP
jgi:sugar-specific transcriptional regulator TrmB